MAIEKSASVTVTSGSADAYGSWVELIASVVTDSEWIHFRMGMVAHSTFRLINYFDLGTGTVGNEVVSHPAIPLQNSRAAGSTSFEHYYGVSLPIKFTAGDRISVRVADPGAALAYVVHLQLFNSVL